MEAVKRFLVFPAVLIAVCGLSLGNGEQKEHPMVIHSMDIDCKITSRFSRTFITTEIRNQLNSSHEAVFAVELPKTAFITNFIMTIDGVTTVGAVKKKAVADKQYRGAVSRGESAALVQSTGRTMEHFKISVNVGALATAIFKLTYEELLKRHHGIYELQLKVRPRQLVENFQIKVDIVEPQEITFVKAHGSFITNELSDTVDINHTRNKARIVFKPTVDQQRKCTVCTETHLDGDFVVKYDVKRETSAGNIQIVNGYFVHYFAPTSLQRVPKNVVFVIDCSGSMRGRKIEQTFQAFTKILEDLPEEDYVGILKFNHESVSWKENLVKADPDNILSAKAFVERIIAQGSTNIYSALLSAAKMLKDGRDNKMLPEISTSMVIFLSDGDPTEGILNLNEIMKAVKEAMGGVATLYSLGFGSDVDYNFLEKMSLENGGLARRIYEDSDSALQLQNFYKEIAFPVLLDVNLQYPDLPVSDLTQNNFRHFYQGSEIVVAGHIGNNDVDVLLAQVTGQGVSEPFSMTVETQIQEEDDVTREQRYIFGDFTERLWAYLTIEQLLSKQVTAEAQVQQNITEEALALCLKYSFVTPLTSMVITTSDDDTDKKSVVANKPMEGDALADISYHTFRSRIHHHHAGRTGVSHNPAVLQRQDVNHQISKRIEYLVKENPLGAKIARSYTRDKSVPPIILQTLTVRRTDCKNVLALVSMPPSSASSKICLAIDETPETILNLFHSSDRDLTLNGRLAADKSRFDTFGIVQRKKMVEITAENITVTSARVSETMTWAPALHGTPQKTVNLLQMIRYVRKEGEKVIISFDSGFRAIISLAKNPDQLNLNVENKNQDLNSTTGVIGQLISDNSVRIETDQIVVNGKTIPAQSCEIASHGRRQERCLSVNVKADDWSVGRSYVVPDIFHVPQTS